MPEKFEFKYLFTPIKVGPVTLRNRLMVTAHGTAYIDPNPSLGHAGVHNERYAYYLAERIKGGVGLVTFGAVTVHPTADYEVHHGLGKAYDKAALPGMKLATEMVHQYGGKVFIQLMHAGVHTTGVLSKRPAWGASAVPGLGVEVGWEQAKVMEIEEIQEVIEYYGRCAENAVEGGFDGVEVHGGTSYLPHQFLSPFWNRRTDEYGGSLENRLRFFLQVIDKVKSILPASMALGVRLTVDDFVPAGVSINDMKEVARRLEATGKIDYINVNVGFHGPYIVSPTMYEPHGIAVPYSAALKEVVNIPVVAVARIVDPREAEKVLADGHGDIIGITRGHVADPEIGNKAREGRLDEIRFCTGCRQICVENVTHGLPMDCTQNPTVGREKLWGIGTLKPAEKKKRVMVVGGGPGGMEAAWVAAARGHQVTLYEKTNELGGQIRLAAKLPGRAESWEWARFRLVMLEKYGVKVVLNKEITAADVLRENPDAVVVATGSVPLRDGFQGVTGQPIPGWNLPHVTVVDDILEGRAEVGKNVLILDEEGHIKAPGIADLLSSQGKQVEIVSRHFMMGRSLDSITRPRVYRIMAEQGFKHTPATFIKSIDKGKVTLISTGSGKPRVQDGVDTVILITGRKANEELYFALKGKVKELYRIGDCIAPRLVDAAIYDGHQVGRQL